MEVSSSGRRTWVGPATIKYRNEEQLLARQRLKQPEPRAYQQRSNQDGRKDQEQLPEAGKSEVHQGAPFRLTQKEQLALAVVKENRTR